jgi:Nitrile hydratase, alpha chain
MCCSPHVVMGVAVAQKVLLTLSFATSTHPPAQGKHASQLGTSMRASGEDDMRCIEKHLDSDRMTATQPQKCTMRTKLTCLTALFGATAAAVALQAAPVAAADSVQSCSWTDPDFAARVVDDTPAAIAELDLPEGIAGAEGEHLQAVANRPGVHNPIICSQCSCFPWPVLGLPLYWYKDRGLWGTGAPRTAPGARRGWRRLARRHRDRGLGQQWHPPMVRDSRTPIRDRRLHR